MPNPPYRATGAPIRRGTTGTVRRAVPSAIGHSLADHQDAEKSAPNDQGPPTTPTEYAPGAAFVDLNEMQGGRPCLDEVELPDI